MTTSAHNSTNRTKTASMMMIAWRSECYRSSTTADMFDADLKFIWPQTGKGSFGKSLRYLVSFWRTFWLVLTHRPTFAIVMNLPAFAPMAAQLAAFLTGTAVILDFHSGGITSEFWSKFTPLYKFIAKRAPFVICHNPIDGAIVEAWGGTPFYLTALPRDFNGIDYQSAPAEPTILVICSFKSDEPIEILIHAMRLCPQVHFNITGNYHKAGLQQSEMPANVTLLGFIPYSNYIARMAASTAIITMSDRDYIMQAAVHEALSLGVPVITNTSPTIEGVLGDAGVYTRIDPKSLAEAITHAVAIDALLRERMIARKRVLRLDVSRQMDRVLTMGRSPG